MRAPSSGLVLYHGMTYAADQHIWESVWCHFAERKNYCLIEGEGRRLSHLTRLRKNQDAPLWRVPEIKKYRKNSNQELNLAQRGSAMKLDSKKLNFQPKRQI